MPHRFTGVFALAVLAGLCSAPLSPAKPPDLPENLIIIVQPIQPLRCEFEPVAKPCYVDRQAYKAVDPAACRSVLDNLNLLLEAGEQLRQAKKHAAAGETGAALERIDRVRALAPGSNISQQCDEVVLTLYKKLAARNAEEACEGDCCPCVSRFTQVAHCWLSQAAHFYEKARAVHDGKAVMVEGLLKGAHLAMSEGRAELAADLVRQARAISPQRVEADPLVYKMHLLDEKPAVKGGEEASEPLPVHPRQAVPAKVKATVSFDLKSKAERTCDFLAGMQFRLEAPPKGCQGCVLIGVTAGGSPTLVLHTRCPATGVQWHVCLGGRLPVVWTTAD